MRLQKPTAFSLLFSACKEGENAFIFPSRSYWEHNWIKPKPLHKTPNCLSLIPRSCPSIRHLENKRSKHQNIRARHRWNIPETLFTKSVLGGHVVQVTHAHQLEIPLRAPKELDSRHGIFLRLKSVWEALTKRNICFCPLSKYPLAISKQRKGVFLMMFVFVWLEHVHNFKTPQKIINP